MTRFRGGEAERSRFWYRKIVIRRMNRICVKFVESRKTVTSSVLVDDLSDAGENDSSPGFNHLEVTHWSVGF